MKLYRILKKLVIGLLIVIPAFFVIELCRAYYLVHERPFSISFNEDFYFQTFERKTEGVELRTWTTKESRSTQRGLIFDKGDTHLYEYKGTKFVLTNHCPYLVVEIPGGVTKTLSMDWHTSYQDFVPESISEPIKLTYNTKGNHWLGFLFNQGNQSITFDKVLQNADKWTEENLSIPNSRILIEGKTGQPFRIYTEAQEFYLNLVKGENINFDAPTEEANYRHPLQKGKFVFLRLKDKFLICIESLVDDLEISGYNNRDLSIYTFSAKEGSSDMPYEAILVDKVGGQVKIAYKEGHGETIILHLSDVETDYIDQGKWLSRHPLPEPDF